MLWIIAISLLFLWVLAVATSNTMYGYVHILFVLAMLAALLRVILRRGVL